MEQNHTKKTLGKRTIFWEAIKQVGIKIKKLYILIFTSNNLN